MTKKRLLLYVLMVYMLIEECHLGYAMPLPYFNIVCIKNIMEVFIDDFSVYGATCEQCLNNLSKVLQRCEHVNLVLNWEQHHFMVQDGVVPSHDVSSKGIEVSKAKVEVIDKLPPPTSLKCLRSFLGHVGFYW